MEVQLSMVLIVAGCLLAVGGLIVWIVLRKKTAYLEPVREELRKEKYWLRRNEYNAAMVKGRQNLELLLKLVAEKQGIQLDNTAQAMANAKELEEREHQNGRRKRMTASVMTHKQFNRWLVDNGYLDRVARWEINQVRLIGNKAVHENYSDKDDAWSQYEYLEDILKTISERGQTHAKRQERRREAEEKMAKQPDILEQQKPHRHRRRRKKTQNRKPQDSTSQQKPQSEQKQHSKQKQQNKQKKQHEDKQQNEQKQQNEKKQQNKQKKQHEDKQQSEQKQQSEHKKQNKHNRHKKHNSQKHHKQCAGGQA